MWNIPPIIKIYEAFGAVVDERLEVSGNTARCYSSSGNKFYDVSYSSQENAIMTNDNGSYWNGYLGYPAIAFLLQKEVLEYKPDLAIYFKDIQWKDINQKFKNDFDKSIEFIFRNIEKEKREEIEEYAYKILGNIENLKLSKLGERQKPPSGY